MTRRLKKISAVCGSSLVLMLLICFGVYWMVMTGAANDMIKRFLEDELSTQLGMPCTIGEILGNPLGRYRVLRVEVGNDFSVDTIGVRFEPVFGARVVLDSLFIRGAHVRITPDTTSSEPLTLDGIRTLIPFDIRHLGVSRCDIELGESDKISDLLFEGSFQAEGDHFKLEAKQYQSHQFQPPLVISNLSGVGVLDDGRLGLQDVEIALPESHFYISGHLEDLPNPKFDFRFRADPIRLSDLTYFLTDPPISSPIHVEGTIEGSLGDIQTQIWARLEPASVYVDAKGSLVPLHLEVFGNANFEGLDPSTFGVEVQGLTLSGAIELEGQVDTTGIVHGDLEGAFTEIAYQGILQNKTTLAGQWDGEKIVGQVSTLGNLGIVNGAGAYSTTLNTGHVNLSFERLLLSLLPDAPPGLGYITGQVNATKDSAIVADIQLDKLDYDSIHVEDVTTHLIYLNEELQISDFAAILPGLGVALRGNGLANVSEENITGSMDLQSVVSLKNLEGGKDLGDSLSLASTIDLEFGSETKAEFSVRGNLSGSTTGLDSILAKGNYSDVSGLAFSSEVWGESGRFDLSGGFSEDQKISGEITGRIRSFEPLSQLTGYSVVADSVNLYGEVSGTVDIPVATIEVSVPEGQVDDIPIRDLHVSGHWVYPDSGSVAVRMASVSWGSRVLQGFFLDASMGGKRTDFLVGSKEDEDDRFYLWGHVETDGTAIGVVADSMHVQASQVALFNKGPLSVQYDSKKGFHVGQFELVGKAGRIVARDHPDLRSAIEVSLLDIDLRPWAFLFGQPNIEGILNADFAFSGGLEDPLIFAEGSIKDIVASGIRFSEINSNLSYGDQRVLVDVSVNPQRGQPITISGSVPIQETESVQLDVRSKGFALAVLDTFIGDVQTLKGNLDIDLNVRGTLGAPEYKGELRLEDGAFGHSSIGRDHEPIFAKISLAQNRVMVDSFKVGKGGQYLSVKGYADLMGGALGQFDIKVDMARFRPIQWPEVQAELSGRVNLNGTPARPRVTGNLVVQQADIRLGDLMVGPSSGWEEDPLVQALQMTVSVKADQQVWVRDPTFNIEMVGDLDVVKDAEGFKVFGNMRSRRGSYLFQSRRLGITRGEMVFQGKTEIDPNLDIVAETRVMARLGNSASSDNDVAEPVNVTVTVGGTLSHPDIQLSSSPTIDRFEDIVSVLLVGATRDAAKIDNADAVAGDLLLGVLANRFGQELGENLNLDLVEVDVAESNISRVRVGKYLTPRLFVSYAQDMSSTGREVAVEYKLLPSLTIEAKQIDGGNEEQLSKKTRESIGVVWEKEW